MIPFSRNISDRFDIFSWFVLICHESWHVSVWVCCDRKDFKVVYCVMVSFHLWLLTVKSEKSCSVFQSLPFLITLKHNCIRKKIIWISLEKVKHKLLLLKQPNKAYKSKQLTIFSVIDSNVRSIFLLICLGFVFNISHHTVHYYISNYQ